MPFLCLPILVLGLLLLLASQFRTGSAACGSALCLGLVASRDWPAHADPTCDALDAVAVLPTK